MMTTDPIESEILRPMRSLYPYPPRKKGGEDPSEEEVILMTKSYTAALRRGNYDQATLKAAWGAVVASHARQDWPSAATIIRACEDARASQKPVGARTKPSQTAWRLVWDRARCERLAFTAVQQGVSNGFKLAILDGKRPEQVSIPELVRGKMLARATADRLESGEPLVTQDGRNLGCMPAAEAQRHLVVYERMQQWERVTADEIRRHQVHDAAPYRPTPADEDVKGLL